MTARSLAGMPLLARVMGTYQPSLTSHRLQVKAFGSDSESVQTLYGDSWGWFIDDVRIYTCETPDPSTVSLTYPTGSEVWKPGENETITWTGPSKMAYATLRYSLDKGATWKTIEKNLTGTEYVWEVPLQPNNKNGLMKITGFDSKGASLESSTVPFSIEVVRVTYPNGGETLTSGDDTQSITWTTNTTKADVAKVQLFYTKNGGTTWISVYTYEGENPETHPWTVPYLGFSCKNEMQSEGCPERRSQ